MGLLVPVPEIRKPSFELGERVRFTQVFERRTRYLSHGSVTKRWEATVRLGEGVIVGVRHLQNGTKVYLGWEDGAAWRYAGNVPAAIVYTDLRRKPVYVPLDAIVHVEEVGDATG